MRNILVTLCVLAALAVVGCRSTFVPTHSTGSSSPPPTSIAPQAVPEVTREATPGPASTPIATSGVRLTATVSPTCPGPERPGQVCTRPYEGEFVVANDVGAEVARVSTGQNGMATIDLPPGDYTITPRVEGPWPSGPPAAVTVPAGQYVEVSVELDSGIR